MNIYRRKREFEDTNSLYFYHIDLEGRLLAAPQFNYKKAMPTRNILRT
jgi:hypothetical protein